MAKRVQSPSSINLYKQCPRKYYYQYVLKLPTKPSIHLVRGSVVHEVLEKFFELDIASFDENEFEYGLRSYALASLIKRWKSSEKKLKKLGLSQTELDRYFIESQQMLNNFIADFSAKLKKRTAEVGSINQAFKDLSPIVEEEIKNHELMVRGFIDAIHDIGDEITIIDYKTSNKDIITPEYRLQLGIYALLYKLKYDKLPKKVGINFLKFGEKMMDVDEGLLKEAEREIRYIHEMTESVNIVDYPKQESPLCRWHSGQCDFYDECRKD